MKSNPLLEKKLEVFCQQGYIEPRKENNSYLKLSYKGTGGLISPKWNVKIYNTGSIVCNDYKLLQDIIDEKVSLPDPKLRLLQIDDAGVGFPLLGTMVGVTDGTTIQTDVVDVKYFQIPYFSKQTYLTVYKDLGLKIVQEKFHADPSTYRIEICTGHINTVLKEALREKGFDVRVVEIKGLLQDSLENLFKEYVKKMTGKDFAYDPKDVDKKDLSKKYYIALNWGLRNAQNLLKSGWSSMTDKL